MYTEKDDIRALNALARDAGIVGKAKKPKPLLLASSPTIEEAAKMATRYHCSDCRLAPESEGLWSVWSGDNRRHTQVRLVKGRYRLESPR